MMIEIQKRRFSLTPFSPRKRQEMTNEGTAAIQKHGQEGTRVDLLSGLFPRSSLRGHLQESIPLTLKKIGQSPLTEGEN
jgi:hypothetical protein